MEPDMPLACVSGVSTGPANVRALYEASYPRLVQVLTVAAGNRAEAEDVVQEAFVRLLPRWSQISRYDDPEAWVRKVAFRLLSNRFRRARTAALSVASAHRPTLAVEATGDSIDLDRVLIQLPLAQRQVLVLHHMLDLSIDDIAAELGVPTGTVKSRLARARAAFANLVPEESRHG
jgi:RNA polymerase sigma-70 factor, ECF subfamily